MSWWHRFWSHGRMEEELDKELRFHLDQHAADLVAQGHNRDQARRLAALAFGGAEQIKEECRDARGTRWLDDFLQDCRYAVRTLGRRPGFTAVALLTLALGIGATTVMFTVVNGVLLKPLPYREPDRLVVVQEQTDWSTRLGNLWAFAYPNFVDCRREVKALDLAAWRTTRGLITKRGDAEFATGREVSANLLSVLGVAPMQGRAFVPEDDRPGAPPVAIIGYTVWQRRLGGGDAIGMPIVFDGNPYTVIGIAPPWLRIAGEEPDLLTPIGRNPALENRERHPGIQAVGRLQPGATLAQARAELAAIGRHLAEEYPKSNRGRTFIVDPLRPDVGDVSSTLWLLLGAVGLVLGIACANIASLLLARAISRQRELAMRAALGAGRGRLVRQCLTESAVLALAGGACGVLLATTGVRPFVTFWPGSLPRAEEVQLDWHVLVFAAVVSLASGVLFGLIPALRATVRDLEQALRTGSRTLTGNSRRLHGAFVIAEVALAVVLLVPAGMLGRALLKLSALDSGVAIHNVLTARVALSPAILADPSRTRAAWQNLLERAQRLPGVRAIAMVDTVPMREGNNPIPYRTSAAPVPPDRQPMALANSVSADYMTVMGIPLREGRFFDEHDRAGSEAVVVIDDVMAQQAFAGAEPLGKHVWIGLDNDPYRVVGIVGHVRYWGPAGDDEAQVRAQIYYPFTQLPDRYVRRWSELMSIAVRTDVPPLSVVEALKHEVRGATGDQVMYEIRTMEQLSSASLARQRFLLLLFGLFATLALVLSCVGIYGVLTYLTNQRVPEIGIRMALGATAGRVVRLVIGQGMAMILVGVTIGILAALGAARVLRQSVEGISPPDPSTFVVVVAVFVTAALAASFIPARRASRLDAVHALRQE